MNEKIRSRINEASEIVFFDKKNGVFININFGTGDNLDSDDIEAGFNDYVNIYTACLANPSFEEYAKNSVIAEFENGGMLDDVGGYGLLRTKYGIVESNIYDGGMMMFKQKDYYKEGEFDKFVPKLLDNVMDYMGAKLDDLEMIWFHENKMKKGE